MTLKQEKPLTSVLKYTITLAACVLISFVVACIMGLFTDWETLKNKLQYPAGDLGFINEYSKNMYVLTNATFVTGVLCFAFGVLFVLANGGAFEMLVYGISRFFSLFQKDPSKVKFKTFYDYHMYKSAEPKTSFLFMIIDGLIIVLLSGVFLILWYQSVPH